jgi:hypothetical protein
MRHEELRKLLRAQPFRPLTIHLPEGRRVPIVHHDFAVLSPDGRTLLAYEPDNSFNMIDVMLIASVEVGPPPPPKTPADANGPPAA